MTKMGPVPPQSIQAEQSVLGGLLLDGSAWVKVQGVLNEQDFYLKPHKILFRALMVLLNQGDSVDAVIVSDYLSDKGLLETVGGTGFLVNLVNGTPSAANIAAYASIVQEKSLLRQLISLAGSISEQAFNTENSAKEVITNAEMAIFSIAQQGLRGKPGFSRLRDILRDVVGTMEDNLERPENGVLGVPTGFADLDALTSGLNGGELVVVAGRPSMGKTAFSMNIAEHAAIVLNLPVAVFSLEMQADQLGMRMLSSTSDVPLKRIRESWNMKDTDWPLASNAISRCGTAPLFIDDTPMLTIADLRSRCMRLQSEYSDEFTEGLGMIVVDYIQLMCSTDKNETRNNQIEAITRGLKRLAKDFNVPVLAMSQLNRKLETRPNKRPIMSDLRESGGIEQDADIVLFLYRDEVYHADSLDKGLAELIVSKQRNGALGTVKLAFECTNTRFRNVGNGVDAYE